MPKTPPARFSLGLPAEPPRFGFQVLQTRVAARLCTEHPPAKVIAVVAPTGYGKTVLLSTVYDHYAQQNMECVWVSLDERDQSAERLLGKLEAAVLGGSGAAHPTMALHEGDAPIDQRIDALTEALSQNEGSVMLFLDNLNQCADGELQALLDALVFQTPSWVYVVLASTRGLSMNRARARLEGRLRDVTTEDLSLDRDEVRALLGAPLCELVGAEGLELLQRVTEGWPAAVRLSQIVLASARDPLEALRQFSGSDSDLAELLNRQVLHGFDADLRQFLLELSLLRNYSAELAAEATGNPEAARYVDDLLRRNVFVIPLDRSQSWFRLHALFRDFLLNEAERSLTEKRKHQVRARAAHWCEKREALRDAVDYALAAGDNQLAGRILERNAAVFVRDLGSLHLYIAWVEQLLEAEAEIGWEPDLWYVWALVFYRRYDYARLQIERIDRRIEAARTAGEEAGFLEVLSRRAQLIRSAIDIYTDQIEVGHRKALDWLQEAHGDDPFDIATMAAAASIYLASMYDFVEARKQTRIAQHAIQQARSAYGLGWVTTLTAMIPMYEGDIGTASQDLKAAFVRARRDVGAMAGITGTIALVAADCAVTMGEDVEAREFLKIGLRRAQTHGVADTAVCGLGAALRLWSGEDDELLKLAQLREIAAGYPPRVSIMFSCHLAQRLIRLGRLDEAQQEASQLGIGVSSAEGLSRATVKTGIARADELIQQTELELLIAQGRLRQAEALAAEASRQARKAGRMGHLVELSLAEMALDVQSQSLVKAAGHLTRAVSIATKRHIRRPFRDRAEVIAGLVNETKPQSWGFALDEERRFFAEICRSLPALNVSLLDQLDRLDVEPTLLEKPTAREMEMLQLVEAGLSNQQLADRLSVSVATVKWHLYNLYTKLGVSSRSAALARARALNLLNR